MMDSCKRWLSREDADVQDDVCIPVTDEGKGHTIP